MLLPDGPPADPQMSAGADSHALAPSPILRPGPPAPAGWVPPHAGPASHTPARSSGRTRHSRGLLRPAPPRIHSPADLRTAAARRAPSLSSRIPTSAMSGTAAG